ncbi:CheR family methyltransferase [Pseudomonas flexibilis]|uniref:CheR family methyltransferase n=1 Tax=Pseudomonas flexibilis TaxID=706570 RepID=UPI00068D6652|nr:protein-glutamate O-methyltransferase CheR [Pseudomonas flexibilis]SCY51531.1 chemotaxis protein methyltransferase CheR [Pseudomonas flexibilis]
MSGVYGLSTSAFRHIREAFHRGSGIDLPESKRQLVAGRLYCRLKALGLPDFDAYVALLQQPEQALERQCMVDLLTTNETYFFREPEHFRYLAAQILPTLRQRPVRVWCAAASTGEEPYSLAMLLQDKLGDGGWSLLASDLSTRVLGRASQGLYPLQRLELLPQEYLKRFCLRGTGDYEGQLLIRRELREKVRFCQHNLLDSAADLGQFDIIFLRNVLIYFNGATRHQVIQQVLRQLRPGGWLIIGHSESLQGVQSPVQLVRPSVYRLPASLAAVRADLRGVA